MAGIAAVAILSVLLLPYSLQPVHKENYGGNTDYVWESNALWSRMTEGISFGKFDANGFNNAKVVEDPDIVVVGSSHAEAVNVLQTENFAALLGQEFEGIYTTYNMGISGHHFLKVCKYLPRTMELNPKAKYIIIETSNVTFDEKDVASLLNGTVDYTPSVGSGLVVALQKLPFARIVYSQLTGGLMDMLMPSKAQLTDGPEIELEKTSLNESVYDELFTYMRTVMEGSNAELIIMYHPTGHLQQDGSALFQEDDAALAVFSEKCGENGFSFVDMTASFAEMYEKEYKLPHGFVTGKVGTGHLNADGHAKIAEELVKCITALMEVE